MTAADQPDPKPSEGGPVARLRALLEQMDTVHDVDRMPVIAHFFQECRNELPAVLDELERLRGLKEHFQARCPHVVLDANRTCLTCKKENR